MMSNTKCFVSKKEENQVDKAKKASGKLVAEDKDDDTVNGNYKVQADEKDSN